MVDAAVLDPPALVPPTTAETRVKRAAIVGTAPSWTLTPWHDTTLEIWSLNDAYSSRDALGRPMPRADRWYEQHPLDKLYFRDPTNRYVDATKVPPGFYVRPAGHLEWLQQQARTIPVWLANEPPPGWPPLARRFPIEQVEAAFGGYWACGPSYMLAQAILEGYREIHIYGIHLSTQQEYIEQRPNFEHLLGIARGLGVVVRMAKESPLLRHPWKYAYEPRPVTPVSPLGAEIAKVQEERNAVLVSLLNWPRWKSREAPKDRLRRLDATLAELQQRLRASAPGCGTLTAVLVPSAVEGAM